MSNILSRPTEKQTIENNDNGPVIPRIHSNVACPPNKTNGTPSQLKLTVANNGQGSKDENGNVKLLLKGSQNKNLASYGRNNSTTTKPAKGKGSSIYAFHMGGGGRLLCLKLKTKFGHHT